MFKSLWSLSHLCFLCVFQVESLSSRISIGRVPCDIASKERTLVNMFNQSLQQQQVRHQLRSRSPHSTNVSSFGGSSPTELCSHRHNPPRDVFFGQPSRFGGSDGQPIPQRLRSPIMMQSCEADTADVAAPSSHVPMSATALIVGNSIPPPLPFTMASGTENVSYRSIYASRCAALGDSPNATDPMRCHRSVSHGISDAYPASRSGSSSMGSAAVSSEGQRVGVRSTHHRGSPSLPLATSHGVLHHNSQQQQHQRSTTAQRWYASMDHNPSKVLGAPGLVDDAYSQCISWGSERLAGLLHDQFLLFDVSRPTEVCAAYKLEGGDSVVGGTVASRFSCVAMRPFQDRECVVGDTCGILRFLKCHDGATETVVERHISLAESSGLLGELMLSNEGCSSVSSQHPRLGVLSETSRQPTSLMRVHAAAMASNMSLLFDVSYRSVSCADASDHHPHLFLTGTAAGVVALVDSRIQHLGAVVAQARIALPPSSVSSSTSPCAGIIGDRVLGVSWNSSGSLFAVGSNTSGVSVWSLAKMSEPMTSISVGKPTPSALMSPARRAGATAAPSTSSAAVRGIQFSPVDPFELVYGGGVGDGVISVVNVLHAGGRKLYSAATGAQVSQVRYSPCGSLLISSHGLRSQDVPAPPAGQQPIGAGYEWGGVPDGPCSRRKYCLAVWSRGKAPTTPSLAFLGGAATAGITTSSSSGGRGRLPGGAGLGSHRRSASRDSLDPSDDDDTGSSAVSDVDSMPASDDGGFGGGDAFDLDDDRYVTERLASPMASSASSPSRKSSGRPLQLKIRLDGHTSRPLHMCVPRQNSPYCGMVATAAGGGDDSTIRFWNVFQRQRRTTTTSSSAVASNAAACSNSRRSSPSHDVAPSSNGLPSTAASMDPPRRCGWDDDGEFGALR
jgi:WD40 repeat protein